MSRSISIMLILLANPNRLLIVILLLLLLSLQRPGSTFLNVPPMAIEPGFGVCCVRIFGASARGVLVRGTAVEATIVLAEDDDDLRALYADLARRCGHRVWEAADGAEALAQVRARRPDLLLLDIWMPVLNGLEVLESLGSSCEAVGLKVVVLSHQRDADTRLEGFALGVADYWTKDLSLAELSDRIRSRPGWASLSARAAVDV